MILLGIRDREIRIPSDLGRATLGQSANRDISIPSVVALLSNLESKFRAEMHPTLLLK